MGPSTAEGSYAFTMPSFAVASVTLSAFVVRKLYGSVDGGGKETVSCGRSVMGHWFRLGDLELLVVSDGVMRQDAGAVFGLVPRVMWERYAPKLDDKYRMPLGLNALVVRSAGETVLIDPGVGTKGTIPPGAISTEGSGELL